MAVFDFTAKNKARQFDASEWGATAPIFFKTLNFFEMMAVNEKFECYRASTSTADERFKASFEMLKMTLVNENDEAILTDADFDAIKNAPAQPIIRAWCYATNPEYNSGETFKKK
jgi:hypothetical protein